MSICKIKWSWRDMGGRILAYIHPRPLHNSKWGQLPRETTFPVAYLPLIFCLHPLSTHWESCVGKAICIVMWIMNENSVFISPFLPSFHNGLTMLENSSHHDRTAWGNEASIDFSYWLLTTYVTWLSIIIHGHFSVSSLERRRDVI